MKPATITFKTTKKIKTLLEKEAKEDFRSLLKRSGNISDDIYQLQQLEHT